MNDGKTVQLDDWFRHPLTHKFKSAADLSSSPVVDRGNQSGLVCIEHSSQREAMSLNEAALKIIFTSRVHIGSVKYLDGPPKPQ